MEPSRYDVVVDEDVADEAVRLYSRAGADAESASSRGGRPRGGPALS
ncbi:hypothetical protein [Streptomyces sp. NPDC093094]